MDVRDGAQAALVEALEETDVAAVGDPGLRTVKKSGENNSPISPAPGEIRYYIDIPLDFQN